MKFLADWMAITDLRLCKSFLLIVLSVLFFSGWAHGEDGAIPENAARAQFGSGWECDQGFRKVGQVCEKVSIPDNAYPTNRSYGSAWSCNRGYRRSGDTCVEVEIPENAYLNSPRGDDWECHRGYRKGELGCEAIIVPENGYLTSSTFGIGWKCERGFKKANKSCEAVTIPTNAHLDMSGHDWRCDPPYRKRQDVCVAP